jgi:hypothetical protein
MCEWSLSKLTAVIAHFFLSRLCSVLREVFSVRTLHVYAGVPSFATAKRYRNNGPAALARLGNPDCAALRQRR